MSATFIRQLAHVCLLVRDLNETEGFYRRAFGMNKKFGFVRDGKEIGFYLEVGGATHIEVFANSEAGRQKVNQIDHLCLEVIDMDEAIAHLEEAGIAVSDKTKGCDETWQAWVTDPNGVRIELFAYTSASAQFTGGDRVATW